MIRKYALILISLVVLAGCQQPHGHNNNNTLRMSVNRDPATLDPRRGADVVSVVIHSLLFEGLTKENEDRSISLALAERFDLSEDKKIYTFYLKDTQWSDGSPVTAEDFEYSWKSSLDPAYPCPNAHLFYAISNAQAAKRGDVSLEEVGIKALDAKTLQITLEQPTPYFLNIISFGSFHPVPRNKAINDPDWSVKPGAQYLCNGPYLLKEWRRTHELILAKNPTYWKSEAVQLNGIHISIIQNEMTTLHMYERGELDFVATVLSPIPLDSLKGYLQEGGVTSLVEPGTTVCFFNTESFPFNNLNIRKAFGYALNRKEIVSNITELNEITALEAVSPVLKSKRTPFFEDHAVAQARECLQQGLAELGLKNIQQLGTIVFDYSHSEVNKKLVQAIQQQWSEALGIRVQLRQADYKVHLDNLAKRNYSVAQGIWLAQYPDPMNILERFKTNVNVKNYSGWESPEYSRLLEESNYAETTEEREEKIFAAESMLLENMPFAPVYHWSSAFLAKPYLKVPSCSPTLAVFYTKLSFVEESKR